MHHQLQIVVRFTHPTKNHNLAVCGIGTRSVPTTIAILLIFGPLERIFPRTDCEHDLSGFLTD